MALNKKSIKKTLMDNKRKLITKLDPKSPISEQYRTIRTNIHFSSIDKEIHTLMVTSTGPGEGKSTTAANLAVTFAQQGKQTLIIDADMRKPTVHYTFNQTNTTGLTSVLTNQMPLIDAVKLTDVANLMVLPSGPIPPNPSELLSSRAMQQFIEEAVKNFSVVIFDTPPVLAVTDAQILANQCDGTILVVSSGKTENEQAIKAKELLTAAQGKLLGVVLNNKKMDGKEQYYYYGAN
ncbi:CpsD/CapB family tyrosine-protein kinase [Bacillus sp. ISL-35]|uniref:CpsD/CapB family tyrosine-protein kinase n=1 Tax=Bacillus sp. ISL-35 TaxID=2819122 RepID=UPI001BEB6156|nr:CpsD/CapB family tyrosine-protein kinase [Bacillus sp. ISL-35]MBT2678811.1 CpsD/CapB family tyrosine-protein kinase [Bacillus sp. ISL-35]